MDLRTIPDKRAELHQRIAARPHPRPEATTLWECDDWPLEELLGLKSPAAIRIALAVGDLLRAGRAGDLLEVFLLWAADIKGDGMEVLAVARGVAEACVGGELEPGAAMRIMCRDAVVLAGRADGHRAARALVGMLQESSEVVGYPDLGDGQEAFSRGVGFAVELLRGVAPHAREAVFDIMLRDLEPFFVGYEATMAAREREAPAPGTEN